MMPEAGGELAYLSKAYGRMWGFLFGWMQMLVAKAGSQAAAAVAFGIFLNGMCGGTLSRSIVSLHLLDHDYTLTAVQLLAVALILLVTLLNLLSVTASGKVATVLAALKIALICFIILGAFSTSQGDWSHFAETLQPISNAAPSSLASGFAAAMLAALWAYDGWNCVTFVAGEVANPTRNLPRALIGGTLLVMALYLLVNTAYCYVLTPTEIAQVPQDSSVAREVAVRFMGAAAVGVMSLGLLASSFGTLHTSVLTGARVPYALAQSGLCWSAFGKVSATNAIPQRAVIFQGLWASILALSGTFDTLTDYVVFCSWIFYGMAGASVFVLRRREPDRARPYKVWGYPWVPAIFLLTIGWMLLQTVKDGAVGPLIGLGIVASGVPVYWIWFRKHSM
jgi:APA family basic amino acid/polyamine antiporter